MVRSAALIFATIAATGGASAQGKAPDYVGTWGATAAQCKVAQDKSNAPMVIRAKGLDQHETHCNFTSVQRSGGSWKAKSSCSVQGDKQTQLLTMAVAGKSATYRWNKGPATKLVRC